MQGGEMCGEEKNYSRAKFHTVGSLQIVSEAEEKIKAV